MVGNRRNWHALNWETDEQIGRKRSVDKRGAKSDEAYVRDVLYEMAPARNVLVINDEAHHAWRVPAESKVKGVAKADIEEAAKWVGGLDRIHRARGILTPMLASLSVNRRSGQDVQPSGGLDLDDPTADELVAVVENLGLARGHRALGS